MAGGATLELVLLAEDTGGTTTEDEGTTTTDEEGTTADEEGTTTDEEGTTTDEEGTTTDEGAALAVLDGLTGVDDTDDAGGGLGAPVVSRVSLLGPPQTSMSTNSPFNAQAQNDTPITQRSHSLLPAHLFVHRFHATVLVVAPLRTSLSQ